MPLWDSVVYSSIDACDVVNSDTANGNGTQNFVMNKNLSQHYIAQNEVKSIFFNVALKITFFCFVFNEKQFHVTLLFANCTNEYAFHCGNNYGNE